MKKNLGLLIVLFVGNLLMAAPSLAVTEPPVTDTYDWTGPLPDPDALQGQWFRRISDNFEEDRTNEFYDNVLDSGGGSMSWNAIFGYALNVVYGGGGIPGVDPIISFDIEATITNDVPATSPWADGSNSHEEYLATQDQYEGTLYQTKLTADFALNQFNMTPTAWTSPYRNREPYIVATNEEQEAWYCWTPGNPEPEFNVTGDYYVPTWDFGDIPVGASSTKLLSFSVPAGLPTSDSRYNVIYNSSQEHSDLLLNRTTSLKISTWIDDIAADTGAPYPSNPPLRSSDCSVFHNTEPPTPVELSSFTAAFNTDGPTLYWVTQTEAGNSGWNIYRAETNNIDDAIQVNSSLIQGAGTTFEPTEYSYLDEYAVQVSNTYYYWLESRDESGMIRKYGSISLTIPENNGENPEPPEIVSNLCNYPNPFYPRTEIKFMMAAPAQVKLSIFNMKGQQITTLMNEYISNVSNPITVKWDGTDNKGNELSSGLYLYKLSIGKQTYINKMIISK